MKTDYPRFMYFPRTRKLPIWSEAVLGAFRDVRKEIDTSAGVDKTSNEVLKILRPGLVNIGFKVESGKRKGEKIYRPVFFGEMGRPDLAYEIDAFHEEFGVALEVEASRSIQGNAIYRDLVQMALMVDVHTAVIAVPLVYRYSRYGRATTNKAFDDALPLLGAIWGGDRVRLPVEGMMLLGY